MNFFDNQNAIKAAYVRCVEPVCSRHGLTRMELDILLFLANNPQYDTARDIVEKRRLTKSHVSVSVRALEVRALLEKSYRPDNRKAARLRLLPAAGPIVADGQAAQRRFFEALFSGFSQADMEQARAIFDALTRNIHSFLSEDSHAC